MTEKISNPPRTAPCAPSTPLSAPPILRYALCSKGIQKNEDSPSKGGMALDPPHPNLVGRKSHLHKAQERATTKIKKGKHFFITRDLREGSALRPPSI
jgi:hypothetical protein